MKTQHIIIIILVAIAAVYFFVVRGKDASTATETTPPRPEPVARVAVSRPSTKGRMPLPAGVLGGRQFGDRQLAVDYYQRRGGAGSGCSFIELAGGGFSVEGC